MDGIQIFGCQFDACSSKVLFEAMQLSGPRNWDNPWLLGQQPCKCNLRLGRILLVCDLPKSIHQCLICLARLGGEARNDVAEISLVELCLVGDCTREKALTQWAERDEPYPEFLQRRKDLLLRLSPPQRVFTLECRDGLNRMGSTNGCCASLGHTEVLDLTLLDEVLDCSGHVFDGHIRVDAMLVEQIDHVTVEPLQGGFSHGPDPFRLAVCTLTWHPILEAELRCDDDLVTNRGQRFTDEFFVRKRTVGFGRVEEGHAAVISRADDLHGLIPVHRWAKAEAEPHAAEAEG